MITIDASKSDNPNYKITLSCPGHEIEIIADMPEQITMATSSDWEAIMNFSLAGAADSALSGVGRSIAGALTAAAGKLGLHAFNSQNKYLTTQVWLGTQPLEFPFQLQFNAKNSAMDDVYKPIGWLTAMVLPINGNLGLLNPPGPRIAGGGGIVNDYGVDIRIGRLAVFRRCIITACQASYDTRLDSKGVPIAGEAELTIRTNHVYGAQDFLVAMGLWKE